MKHEYLVQMSDKELDAYGSTLGVDVSGIADHAGKVDEIESYRGRSATVRVMGLEITVAMKRLHDKRLMDEYGGKPLTNSVLEGFVAALVGEDQMQAIRERCTDDDGTIDADAYLTALTLINRADELKN